MHKHLPSPNKLPRSKYYLLKLLDKLFINGNQIFKRFRLCEDCLKLLGEWSPENGEIVCENCESRNTSSKIFHFDLGVLIKNLLQFRDLGDLLLTHKRQTILTDEYVSSITSGSEYTFFQTEILKNDYDVCLLWNVDDTPLKKSSKSHVCMVQSQICNIPRKNRRNFQFVSGIYYSKKKNPKMNSFLLPFVNSLRSLGTNGIEWFNTLLPGQMCKILYAPMAREAASYAKLKEKVIEKALVIIWCSTVHS